MSAIWLLPFGVLLLGAVVLLVACAGMVDELARTAGQVDRLGRLQPALVELEDDAAALAATVRAMRRQ